MHGSVAVADKDLWINSVLTVQVLWAGCTVVQAVGGFVFDVTNPLVDTVPNIFTPEQVAGKQMQGFFPLEENLNPKP